MIARQLHAPLAHGVGRYFDAFGAIALGKAQSHFEGQVAMQLGFAADPAERRPYLFEFSALPNDGEKHAQPMVDLRLAVREAVDDLLAGRSAATVAGRFHATLVAAAVEMVQFAARKVGRLPVVLTGGCFQNARLLEDLRAALAPAFRVYTHEQVPPNDGGIALGQAMVAAAQLAASGVPLEGGDLTCAWRFRDEWLPSKGRRRSARARVDFGGVTRAGVAVFVPEVELGDYVLVHVGFAIARIDEEAARPALAACKTVGEIGDQPAGERRCVTSTSIAIRKRFGAGRAHRSDQTRPWTLMESVRRPDALDLQVRPRRTPAGAAAPHPRPRLPGLRHAARADRSRPGDRRHARA